MFIGSITFEIKGKEYHFSDISEDYYYWIDKDEPRLIIDEEYGRIEMDIYQFDDYTRYFGMDEKNYNYTLQGK